MKSKRQILFFFILALVAIALLSSDVKAWEHSNKCFSCHTIYSGGPTSTGHTAHLNIGLPGFCNTCHEDVGDTPHTIFCTVCHLKKGIIRHHYLAAGATNNPDISICAMCHNPVVADPEDTIPTGFEGTCLNPCDGSEELFSIGSFTLSLDNDGDLLVNSADPDCFVCSPTVRVVRTPPDDPVDYISLQAAYNDAFEDDIICGNKTVFNEDIYIDLGKNVFFEGGFNCNFTSINGKTTVNSLTIESGSFILKGGVLQIQIPA